LPLVQFTKLSYAEIRQIATMKLGLVGLRGFEDYEPARISGGMQKRAALARAIALDPEFLFLDEPSAGLDPITAKLLDEPLRALGIPVAVRAQVRVHDLFPWVGHRSPSRFAGEVPGRRAGRRQEHQDSLSPVYRRPANSGDRRGLGQAIARARRARAHPGAGP